MASFELIGSFELGANNLISINIYFEFNLDGFSPIFNIFDGKR
jgi:hypothetical protein